MKNYITKMLGIAMIALASGLIPIVQITPKAEAQVYGYGRGYYSGHIRHDGRFYGHRRFFRHPVRIYTNRDFFIRRDLFGRYPFYGAAFPGYFSPRQFVIADRSGYGSDIVVTNALTGPFSVNRAIITVDRDIYDRFASGIDIDRDIDIEVDTGGNIVRFNTIAGDIDSGDIDIDVD